MPQASLIIFRLCMIFQGHKTAIPGYAIVPKYYLHYGNLCYKQGKERAGASFPFPPPLLSPHYCHSFCVYVCFLPFHAIILLSSPSLLQFLLSVHLSFFPLHPCHHSSPVPLLTHSSTCLHCFPEFMGGVAFHLLASPAPPVPMAPRRVAAFLGFLSPASEGHCPAVTLSLTAVSEHSPPISSILLQVPHHLPGPLSWLLPLCPWRPQHLDCLSYTRATSS